MRSSKAKNDDEDKEEESFDEINYILKQKKLFSSHHDSKSFLGSSTVSSKRIVLKFSRIANFAKGIYKQIF
jgi:hypothetical protein